MASCSRLKPAISGLTRNRLSTFPAPACNSTSWCCSDQSIPTKTTAHTSCSSLSPSRGESGRPNSSARRRASTNGAQRHDILSSPLLSSPRGGGTVLPQGWLRRATRLGVVLTRLRLGQPFILGLTPLLGWGGGPFKWSVLRAKPPGYPPTPADGNLAASKVDPLPALPTREGTAFDRARPLAAGLRRA